MIRLGLVKQLILGTKNPHLALEKMNGRFSNIQ